MCCPIVILQQCNAYEIKFGSIIDKGWDRDAFFHHPKIRSGQNDARTTIFKVHINILS